MWGYVRKEENQCPWWKFNTSQFILFQFIRCDYSNFAFTFNRCQIKEVLMRVKGALYTKP